MLKNYVQKKLEQYVQEYFLNHPDVKLVAVAGSVGKTSTKMALGTILSQAYTVRVHEGNLNTEIGAPMSVLGLEIPEKTRSVIGWWRVLRAAKYRAHNPDDVQIIIQELGVDKPGDMANFARYLRPHLALVTAITPEHMEFFGTIEAVAKEEMSVSDFSEFVLINRDDIEGRFASFENNPNFSTYGTSAIAEYTLEPHASVERFRSSADVSGPEVAEPFTVHAQTIGDHSLRPIAGAVAAALRLGLTPEQIAAGVAAVRPVPGRMNPLHGIDGTLVIDDSYNSSPAAAAAALQTLYQFESEPQRIAVLGSMNELGASSAVEHQRLGELCNPNLLAWVVVVGDEAAQHLAPAAKARGCQVRICQDAIEAGQFVRSVTEEGAVILVKGSQGNIYLEETVKILCDMTEDVKLVRQSLAWMQVKNDYFSRFSDQQVRDTLDKE